MTDLVDPNEIERIVGHERRPFLHLARAITSEETVYILHSACCVDSGLDLRHCQYSLALGDGIDLDVWAQYMDQPVVVSIAFGKLVLFPLIMIGEE